MADDPHPWRERILNTGVVAFGVAFVVAVASRPADWPVVLGGVGVTVIGALVVAERMWERRRRCPNCGRRGFVPVFESETADGRFFQVARCRHCGLYRRECGADAADLDPTRWEQQTDEWAGRPGQPHPEQRP